MSDDDAVCDRIEKAEDDSEISRNSITNLTLKAYGFEWPYVCFTGIKNNYLFILNVYDKKIINRVQL